MTDKPIIVWFRNDLRLSDNPALHQAAQTGAPLLFLYIDETETEHARGGASKWWLHYSLTSLEKSLKNIGAKLLLFRGAAQEILPKVTTENGASKVFWNRRYAHHHILRDKDLKEKLENSGIEVRSFNGSLLREPWEVKTKSGGYYRVFTPFWKSLRDIGPARGNVLSVPKKIVAHSQPTKCESLSDWNLTPEKPNWAKAFSNQWSPGESNAQQRLDDFIQNKIEVYAEGRDYPARSLISRLSPHLAFGEISPLQIWFAVKKLEVSGNISAQQTEKFLSEIAWREFSNNILYHKPEMMTAPLREEFQNYPWSEDLSALKAWQKGMTGYPIVDAGMRELWQTGWMHNRVRMIVASFLVKDMHINWRHGASWFWDTLVDADLANNSQGWQWVAGCGADAAPFFRIFNPVTQSQKFDPEGEYIRKFVPELAEIPEKFIHAPWTGSAEVLSKAGVQLGKTYPAPILDHSEARKQALLKFDSIKQR